MLSNGYLGLGLLTVVLSGYLMVTGFELGSPGRDKLPPEARGPGGYRTFHFWHTGYRGGK